MIFSYNACAKRSNRCRIESVKILWMTMMKHFIRCWWSYNIVLMISNGMSNLFSTEIASSNGRIVSSLNTSRKVPVSLNINTLLRRSYMCGIFALFVVDVLFIVSVLSRMGEILLAIKHIFALSLQLLI